MCVCVSVCAQGWVWVHKETAGHTAGDSSIVRGPHVAGVCSHHHHLSPCISRRLSHLGSVSLCHHHARVKTLRSHFASRLSPLLLISYLLFFLIHFFYILCFRETVTLLFRATVLIWKERCSCTDWCYLSIIHLDFKECNMSLNATCHTVDTRIRLWKTYSSSLCLVSLWLHTHQHAVNSTFPPHIRESHGTDAHQFNGLITQFTRATTDGDFWMVYRRQEFTVFMIQIWKRIKFNDFWVVWLHGSSRQEQETAVF